MVLSDGIGKVHFLKIEKMFNKSTKTILWLWLLTRWKTIWFCYNMYFPYTPARVYSGLVFNGLTNVLDYLSPVSTGPHQNAFWYNNSWLGVLKILNYVPKEREKSYAKNEHSFVRVKCCDGSSSGIILGKIICKSWNWQHIQRLKITIRGANWQLFGLERIAKCSYFILSTQDINFYWFVMKIKNFLLPIWWYNRGLSPLGNKYFVVFVLNGLGFNPLKTNPEYTRAGSMGNVCYSKVKSSSTG